MAAAVSSCEVANAAGRSRRATSPSAMGRSAKTPLPFLGSSHACVCTESVLAESSREEQIHRVLCGCRRRVWPRRLRGFPLRVALFRKKAVSTPPPKPMIVSSSPRSMLGFVWSSIRRLAVASNRSLWRERSAHRDGRTASRLSDWTARERCVIVASSSRSRRRSWRSRSPRTRLRLLTASTPLAARLSGIAPTPSAPQAWLSTPPARAPRTTTAAADSSATTKPPRICGPPLRHRPAARFREGARLLLRGCGSGHPPLADPSSSSTPAAPSPTSRAWIAAPRAARTRAWHLRPRRVPHAHSRPVQHRRLPRRRCGEHAACAYTRNYAERSSVSGRLVKDVVHLGGQLGDVEIVFGCTTREGGSIHEQEADGLMGLGHGENSLPIQLAATGRATARLCYGSFEGGGAVTFGRLPTDSDAVPALAYTPLKPNPRHPAYYVVATERWVLGDSRWRPPRRSPRGTARCSTAAPRSRTFPRRCFGRSSRVWTNTSWVRCDASRVRTRRTRRTCVTARPPGRRPRSRSTRSAIFSRRSLSRSRGRVARAPPANYLFIHGKIAGAFCVGVMDNGPAGTLIGGVTAATSWWSTTWKRTTVASGSPSRTARRCSRDSRRRDRRWDGR